MILIKPLAVFHMEDFRKHMGLIEHYLSGLKVFKIITASVQRLMQLYHLGQMC